MVYGRGNLLEPEKVLKIIENGVAGSSLHQIAKMSECGVKAVWKYQKAIGLI
ncbi:MAG: hypothetical protein HY361_01565 [Candidatus Aenigmarchaeota archaeon]|nr:hypothetical protein [Candidatus Aenigmarchaeota archaeon]